MFESESALYWRRRGVAIAGVVAIVLLLVWAMSGPSTPSADDQAADELNSVGARALAQTSPATEDGEPAPPAGEPVAPAGQHGLVLPLPASGLSSAPGALPAGGLPAAAPSTGLPGAPPAGLPGAGLPAAGLPANGLPANGLPSSGVQPNGLPAAGLPSNGVQPGSVQPNSLQPGSLQPNSLQPNSPRPNGLPSNGLPAGGVQRNGLPAGGVQPGGLPAGGLPASGVQPNGVPAAPGSQTGQRSGQLQPGSSAAGVGSQGSGLPYPQQAGSTHGVAQAPGAGRAIQPNGAPAQPVATVPCSDRAMSVQAQTGADSYKVGQKPRFELIVTNTSTVPCTRDLDPGLQEMVVTGPGQARLWSSNDCFPAKRPDVRTLQPGKPQVFPVEWAVRTSRPGCIGERTSIGPGSYTLVGRLGSITSGPSRFTIVR